MMTLSIKKVCAIELKGSFQSFQYSCTLEFDFNFLLYRNFSTNYTIEDQTRQYNAFEDDIAAVTFYFSKSAALELISTPRLTFIEFFSNVGGLLGLFIGFSVISGIEIIYWLTIGYAENKYDRQKEKRSSVVSNVSLIKQKVVKY